MFAGSSSCFYVPIYIDRAKSISIQEIALQPVHFELDDIYASIACSHVPFVCDRTRFLLPANTSLFLTRCLLLWNLHIVAYRPMPGLYSLSFLLIPTNDSITRYAYKGFLLVLSLFQNTVRLVRYYLFPNKFHLMRNMYVPILPDSKQSISVNMPWLYPVRLALHRYFPNYYTMLINRSNLPMHTRLNPPGAYIQKQSAWNPLLHTCGLHLPWQKLYFCYFLLSQKKRQLPRTYLLPTGNHIAHSITPQYRYR